MVLGLSHKTTQVKKTKNELSLVGWESRKCSGRDVMRKEQIKRAACGDYVPVPSKTGGGEQTVKHIVDKHDWAKKERGVKLFTPPLKIADMRWAAPVQQSNRREHGQKE